MALPCNPVLESCCFLCMFRFLAVQFGQVFGLQLHQFTAMVILYGLDFILQPFDGFLVRGNLTAQHLADLFVPVTVVLVADGAAVIIHPVVNDVTMWMVTVSMPGDDELRVRNSHQLHIVVGNL